MLTRMAFLKPVAGIVAALGLLFHGNADAGSELDAQRELYRQVYAEAELGRWDAVDALSPEAGLVNEALSSTRIFRGSTTARH